MSFLNPTNLGGLFGRFGKQTSQFQRPAAPGLNPGMPSDLNPGQSSMINSPNPVGIDNGLSTRTGIRPPRMPQIRPNPQPGIQQPQYSPMMPSGAVINKFIAPQPGAESMAPPASPGGYGQGSSPGGNMWTLPWQRRLF